MVWLDPSSFDRLRPTDRARFVVVLLAVDFLELAGLLHPATAGDGVLVGSLKHDVLGGPSLEGVGSRTRQNHPRHPRTLLGSVVLVVVALHSATARVLVLVGQLDSSVRPMQKAFVAASLEQLGQPGPDYLLCLTVGSPILRLFAAQVESPPLGLRIGSAVVGSSAPLDVVRRIPRCRRIPRSILPLGAFSPALHFRVAHVEPAAVLHRVGPLDVDLLFPTDFVILQH